LKLEQHGYSLAYRRGYYAFPDQPTGPINPVSELNAAMQPDTPELTLLRLHSRVELPDAQHPAVRIDSVIDPANVDFSTNAQGRRHAHLLVSLIAIPETESRSADHNNQPIGPSQTSSAYIVDLDPPAFQKLLASGMPMHQELALAPGRYRLRLGLTDLGNHHIGTLNMPIEIAPAILKQ
jgi:hypothetical protein